MATLAQATTAPDTLPRSKAVPAASIGLMLLADMAALGSASVVGSLVWRQFVNGQAPPVYTSSWPALFLFLGMFAAEGLYPGVGVGPVELLRRLARGTSLIYLILSAAIFMTKGGEWQSRGGFLMSWLLSLVLLPLARALAHHFFAGKPWFGVPVFILGAGNTASLLIEKLRLSPELALKPIACFDDDHDKHGFIHDLPVVGSIAMAKASAKDCHVRHAILAMPALPQERLAALMETCSVVFPHVLLIPNLMSLAGIPVSQIDVGGILALELRHNLLFASNRYIKRFLDLIMVLLLAPLALCIVALASLCIFLVNPGNPFYWHEREGEGGRPMFILKLRSMYPNAAALLEEHLRKNPAARLEWERYCKLRNDPRILPGIGKFLRRSSLDEVPQLWNILLGQMSLVGPRPFPAYHNEQFAPAFRTLRTKVRPGLTGLWQISTRSDGDLEAQMTLDTYYIRNWSLWLDVFILSRTAWAVLVGRGAY